MEKKDAVRKRNPEDCMQNSAATYAKQRFFCAFSWEETKVPSSKDFSILDFNGGAR